MHPIYFYIENQFGLKTMLCRLDEIRDYYVEHSSLDFTMNYELANDDYLLVTIQPYA